MTPPPIRYKKLGYVELNVSDLGRSREFYEGMVGLQFVDTGPDGGLRFRCSDDPYTIVLHQDRMPGHKRTGLMLEGEVEFDHLFERLQAAGIDYEELGASECADRGLTRAARMVDPVLGAVMEFYLNEATQSSVFAPTHAKIQRLGHAVWGTPRLEEAILHFEEVMNFRPSDYIEGAFAFFHCWPDGWHHGPAIGRTPAAVYHHTNFMVSEVDDIGRALHRAARLGVPVVYGPGRHLASGSAFLYFLDPDGLTCEFSVGMEYFPEDNARAPRMLAATPDVADLWLSPRDPRMGATGHIEQYLVRTVRRPR